MEKSISKDLQKPEFSLVEVLVNLKKQAKRSRPGAKLRVLPANKVKNSQSLQKLVKNVAENITRGAVALRYFPSMWMMKIGRTNNISFLHISQT